MYRLRIFAALALACLFHAASGQTVESNAASAAKSGTPEMTSAPTLKVSTNMVLVDVVATEHGNAIHGLKQAQFHVFENGKEQAIASFDEHSPASSQALAAPPPALPPHVYSNLPQYTQQSAVNVLLLDALNTPMSDQLEVRRQMIRYLGTMPRGTSLAIFTLSSRLRMVSGFTTNAAELVRVLHHSKSKAQQSIVLDDESDKVLNTMEDGISTQWVSPDAIAAMDQFQADLTAYQADQRVQITLQAMEQLARYLSQIPGRKNLIWFSGSFPIALDPDDALRSPFQAMRTYSGEMQEASSLLSAARVAVYPIDARGLLTMPTDDASYSPAYISMSSGVRTQGIKNAAVGQPGEVKENNKFSRELQSSQEGMEQLAGQTGGRAYVNTNEFKEAVSNAIENGSSYYTIGYISGAKDFNGQFRKVQVRVDGCDCQLAYRQGYYANAPDKAADLPGEAKPMTAATLDGAPPSSQILFLARVLSAADPQLQGVKLSSGGAGEMAAKLKKPAHRYVASLIVDARGLAFDALPDGAHQARVEFAMAAYDAEGNPVNDLDHSYDLKINAAQFARTMTAGIPVRMEIDLPAGRIALRIAVRDMSSDRIGSLEVPLEIADK